MMKILFLLSFLYFSEGRLNFHGRRLGGNLGEPEINARLALPPDEYFKQVLDHGNPQNSQVWNQRFFRNTNFYKPGGPVFLMIGGEGEASPKWMVNGTWIEYAKTFNALCFQVEHRFYGKSHPTEDLSISSLAYLSSEQALADLAAFITAQNANLPPGTKWVAFGGSYPGSLAAWLRAKYPHLVHAAISSSAPLLAVADFQDYFRVVEEAVSTVSQECLKTIQTAQSQLDLMLSHRVGQKTAANMFKLCNPVDPHRPEDKQNLYETLAGNFGGIIQYNKDSRTSDSPALTIDKACAVMANASEGVAVKRWAALSNLQLALNNQTCLDASYDCTISQMKNISWNSTTAEGGRQWTYQTCTEFGFFQTSTRNSTKANFGDFPLSLFQRQCFDIFGPDFNGRFLNRGIIRTNTEYGALDFKTDRVFFVHGDVDPWHALGVTQSISPRIPAILIKGTAHCANMYPASATDLPQLTEARKIIEKQLGEWLNE